MKKNPNLRMNDPDDPVSQPMNAINFALDKMEPEETGQFLSDWREGQVISWPSYVSYADRSE